MAISFLNDVSLPGTSTSLFMADGSNIPVGADDSFLKVVDGEPVWSGSAPPAATPPALRSSTSVSVNGNAQIDIAIPSHLAGDLIIVVCVVSYSNFSFFNATTPTGWTRLNASNNGTSFYYNSAIYYKTAILNEPNFQVRAGSSQSSSATYTFQTGACAVFKDTTGISNSDIFNNTTKVNTRTVPSIGASAANSLEVALVTSGANTGTVYDQNFSGTGWSEVEQNARQANFYYNTAGIYQVAGGSPAPSQNDMTITTTNTSTGNSFDVMIGYTSLRLGPE